MITISKVAQPTHCTRFSAVGSAEARRPSSPRSSTIVGTRSRAPAAAAGPRRTAPIAAPTTIAPIVVDSGRPGRTTKTAATGSSRLTPRLAHRPKESRRPRAAAGAWSRVRGASPVGALVRTSSEVLMVAPYAGITRSGSSGRRRVQSPSQPGPPELPHMAVPTLGPRCEITPRSSATSPRTVAAVPVADLPSRHPDDWRAATRHRFLDAVRDGTIPVAAFDTWLVQDARFVADLLRFQARLLARAPRPAQAVLAAGLVSLVDELAWFEEQATARGLDLAAPPRPATARYAQLLGRLDDADVPTALLALWTIERTYLDAWSQAAPGAPAYRQFVEHWTAPGFAGYVAGLAAGAAAVGAGDRPGDDGVFAEVVAAETAFWDMASS